MGPVALPALAQEQSVRVEFSLPAQPLADSLRMLGSKAHVTVVFDPALVRGRTAPALEGSYSAEAALKLLLDGSGLLLRSASPGSYWIGSANEVAAQPGPAASGPTSTAFGGVVQLADVYVVGQRLNTYIAGSTTSANRTETALLDTPQSVSVVTRKLIDDQQARTLADALLNASGVQISSTLNGPQYTVRGFTNAQVSVDGLGNSSFAPMPIWAADSVEVLKGPEAILSGARANYGGSINLTLKQPQLTPIAAWTAGAGSYGLLETGVDFGGAMDAAKSFSYRLVAQADRSRETASGYEGGNSKYIAPSLRWTRGGTDLVIGLERVVKFVAAPVYAISPQGRDRLADDLPVGVFGARDDGSDFDRTRSYFKFEQDLGDSGWTLRSRGEYVEQGSTSRIWQFAGRPSAAGNGVLTAAATTLATRSYTSQTDITGELRSGALSHRLLAGIEYTKGVASARFDIKGMEAFDIHHPTLMPSFGTLPTIFGFDVPSTGTSEAGLLLQDQIAWGESWRGQLALRKGIFHGYGAQSETRRWLPNIGLVYKLNPTASLYASSMRGYAQPGGQFAPDGSLLPGTSSQQLEAGYKVELMERKLSLNASVYRIKVDNSAIAIPGSQFYRSGPGQISRGIELELRGTVSPGFDLSTTLTHLDVKTNNGTPPLEKPRASFSLWAAYKFQSEPLQAWSVAAGVFARGKATTSRNDPVGGVTAYMNNPGNARLDAHVGYTAKNWSLNLGLRNLAGRRLYSVSADDYQALVDDLGRSYLLTARVNF
ncbi:MAG TPA: TonB-dependent receptor [Roseateles sp.]|nr:TonB-dependent receptor [Roseateles sp.]